MQNTILSAIFENEIEKGRQFIHDWEVLRDRILEIVVPQRPELKKIIVDLDTRNQSAFTNLKNSLENPTITIATTGTTSSGKSTIVNFLCGHEIMPVMAQEMSAGIVTIRHHPQKRSLQVQPTESAAWECDEWQDPTDDEIESRLKAVMQTYNRKRGQSDEPACPQIDIQIPIRALSLPEGFRLRLLDLPGLKFMGDEGNKRVIRNCRDALCLVSYNCEEADENKQQELLDEVVRQVKELGGTPARMLFVLNRIDAFLRDKNADGNMKEFVEKITGQIKRKLIKELPEHHSVIDKIKAIKFSSMPAFKSTLMQNGSIEEKRQAGIYIDCNFRNLIPKEILRDLRPLADDWEEHDCKRVAEAVRQTSYAGEFEKMLQNHIEKNFPEIVVPQVISKFRQDIVSPTAGNRNCLQWCQHVLQAELNKSEAEYEKECLRLQCIWQELDEFTAENARLLSEPFDQILEIISKSKKDDPVTAIREHMRKKVQQPPFNQLVDDLEKLSPLWSWRSNIGHATTELLGEIGEGLERGSVPAPQRIELLPVERRYALINTMMELNRLEYAKFQGQTIDAATDEERDHLKNLNGGLNRLADELSEAMAITTGFEAEREMTRIKDTLESIFEGYLAYMWQKSTEMAPGLGFGSPPELKSQLLTEAFDFNYRFSAGINITQEQKEIAEKFQVWKSEKKITGHDRRWYTLWLVESPVYEWVPILVNECAYRPIDILRGPIPKTAELISNWDIQRQANDPEILQCFTRWMGRQFEGLNSVFQKAQTELLERYQSELDMAHKNAAEQFDHDRELLKKLLHLTQGLETTLNEFSDTSWAAACRN